MRQSRFNFAGDAPAEILFLVGGTDMSPVYSFGHGDNYLWPYSVGDAAVEEMQQNTDFRFSFEERDSINARVRSHVVQADAIEAARLQVARALNELRFDR